MTLSYKNWFYFRVGRMDYARFFGVVLILGRLELRAGWVL